MRAAVPSTRSLARNAKWEDSNMEQDIGPDPLKLNGQERTAYQRLYKKRLRDALTIQQKNVPNQTALVWRADLGQLFSELAILQGRLHVSDKRLYDIHKEQYGE